MTKVYYDKKLDNLVLVRPYQASKLYSYNNAYFFVLKRSKPSNFKNLVYLGKFAGDLYEQE